MNGRGLKSFGVSVAAHIFLFVVLGIAAINMLETEEDEKIYEVSLMDFSAPSSVEAVSEATEASVSEVAEETEMQEDEAPTDNATPMTRRKTITPVKTTPKKSQSTSQSQSQNTSQSASQDANNNDSGSAAEEPEQGESTQEEFSPPPVTNSIVSPATPPSVISAAAPEYPYSAQQNGDEGTVVVRILLNKSGGIDEVTVSESSGHGSLDRAAVNAARRMRFSPGLDEYGRPVRCYVYKPFRFALQ
ncbi:MAG: energy transducer TonB [Selenomonadaceae bacterium]|nr:energy transducer TonB [Selenomonadaceae bacterium]